VLAMHVSVAKFLDRHGIDVSMVHAGANKVERYPFNDLSDDARARMQASVDKSYDKFVSVVARGRQNMTADAIRGTEASCYDADDALKIGLIDAIQPAAQAVAAFRTEVFASTTNPQKGASTMATDTAAPGGAGTADTTATAPVAAPAAAAPVVAPAAAADTPDPATAERERVKGITTCEEAKGRESLAQHLAFGTSMSVEDAKKALAAAPAAAPAASAASPFTAAMDGTENPNVGAGGTGTGTKRIGDRMAESYAAVTGVKLRE
jgi:ClpP class serine protease